MIDVSSLSIRRVKENRYVADAYGLRNALPTTSPFDGPRSTIAKGVSANDAIFNLNMLLNKEYGARVANGRVEFDR